MASKALPSPEVLRQLLRYEPETGKLFWLQRPAHMFATEHEFRRWNTRYSGHAALTSVDTRGHLHGKVLNDLHLAHRVIWAMQTGEWPSSLIDHRDCDKSNNRWENLRLATHAENSHNRCLSINSMSGIKGVTFQPKAGKWRARIMVRGRTVYLGWHATAQEAADAYAKASTDLHGAFGRTR